MHRFLRYPRLTCFPTLFLFDGPARGPSELMPETNVQKLDGWGYRVNESCISALSIMLPVLCRALLKSRGDINDSSANDGNLSVLPDSQTDRKADSKKQSEADRQRATLTR